MSRFMFLAFAIICLVVCAEDFLPPRMGWTTWCTDNWRHIIPCMDDYCDEKEILSVAKFMNESLLEYGYNWVNLDDCWAESRDPDTHELVWDTKRFPSGMPSFVQQIHDYGLKISLYTDIGDHTCKHHRPGSWPYYELDAQTFTKWGVDGIKVDWCDHPGGYTAQQLYANFSKALEDVGGTIHLSICEWGLYEPWEWAPDVYSGPTMWRTGPDHLPLWWTWNTSQDPGTGQGTWNVIQHQIGLSSYARSGKWNDPDFLMLGYFWQSERQQKTEFAFWCLLNSPLIVATDVRHLKDKPEMLNKDAIAVNQDPLGKQGDLRVQNKDGGQVWSKPLQSGEHAVILFNMDGYLDILDEWIDIEVKFDDSVIPGWPASCDKASVYDIWKHKTLGNFTQSYTGKKIFVRASEFLRLNPLC